MPSSATLVVEDGTGLSDANTYIDLNTANTYLEDNPYVTVWTDSSDDIKTWALLTATRLIDTYMSFIGSKTSTTQALEWPRTGGTNKCSNLEVANTFIPQSLRFAVVELAVDLLTSDKTRVSATDQSMISSIKLDVISIQYDTPMKSGLPFETPNVISENIKAMLRCYGSVAAGRSSGVKFGKAVRSA